MARHRKRGSSKAGRPRKVGDRFPGGKLKPNNGPNARVLELRRGMLGDAKLDISLASDPIDLAHARGWLTDAQHKAARTLGRLYRQAGFGAPHMDAGGLSEVQPSLQIDARSFATMADEEIETIWDVVFCDEGEVNRESQAEKATVLWGRIMGSLPKAVQSEVFSVCIAGSWPQWIVWQANGQDVPPVWALKKDRLFEGLQSVRDVMRKERPPTPAPLATLKPVKAKRPKIEQPLTFVDEDGEPVEMASEHGVPFEVSRLVVRRA
jgi:hypothetical protein